MRKKMFVGLMVLALGTVGCQSWGGKRCCGSSAAKCSMKCAGCGKCVSCGKLMAPCTGCGAEVKLADVRCTCPKCGEKIKCPCGMVRCACGKEIPCCEVMAAAGGAMKCPGCRKDVKTADANCPCPKCGAPIPCQQMMKCAKCGKEMAMTGECKKCCKSKKG